MSSIRCSQCGKLFDPDESPSTPFCSERCRMVDLGHWLNEDYGLEIEREDAPEEPEAGE